MQKAREPGRIVTAGQSSINYDKVLLSSRVTLSRTRNGFFVILVALQDFRIS